MTQELTQVSLFNCSTCSSELSGATGETVICPVCDSRTKVISQNTTMILKEGVQQSEWKKTHSKVDGRKVLVLGTVLLATALIRFMDRYGKNSNE